MHIGRLAAGALIGAVTSAFLVLPAAAASGNIMVTYAGNGTPGYSGDGGLAKLAKLTTPYGVWLDNAANVFTADSGNHRIRKVTADGVITTVAGSGIPGFSGDGGPATAAKLAGPTAVITNSTGTIYISDTLNNRVRKVTGGIITTIAGTGQNGNTGDGGAATSARLSGPTALALTSAGNLLIADTGNNRVRQVLPNGTISAFAGTGQAGFTGNTGPATSARLRSPNGLATRGTTVLISDNGNNQVRKVVGGTITAFAGTGSLGFAGDGGQATSAKVAAPVGVEFDPSGNAYIIDSLNFRIRQVNASGVISTFAGTGIPGDSADGLPCEQTKINAFGGIGTDADNVFFGDSLNHKVKRCHKNGPPPALAEASGLQGLTIAGSAMAVLGGGFLVTRRLRRRTAASPQAS